MGADYWNSWNSFEKHMRVGESGWFENYFRKINHWRHVLLKNFGSSFCSINQRIVASSYSKHAGGTYYSLSILPRHQIKKAHKVFWLWLYQQLSGNGDWRIWHNVRGGPNMSKAQILMRQHHSQGIISGNRWYFKNIPQKLDRCQGKKWQFHCPAGEEHAAHLHCRRLIPIDFEHLQRMPVWFTAVSERKCSIKSTLMSNHFLAAGHLELQSPSYELAENLHEPRRDGSALELANSSLKFGSRWTSIRPHLNLVHSGADRGSEAASDSYVTKTDSNFRSKTLSSRSFFGKKTMFTIILVHKFDKFCHRIEYDGWCCEGGPMDINPR